MKNLEISLTFKITFEHTGIKDVNVFKLFRFRVKGRFFPFRLFHSGFPTQMKKKIVLITKTEPSGNIFDSLKLEYLRI